MSNIDAQRGGGSMNEMDFFDSRAFGYTTNEHAGFVLNALYKSYESQIDPLCNISIKIDGEHVTKAHLIVLAMSSKMFEMALNSVSQPKTNITFDLDSNIVQVTKKELIEVISYMYTGMVRIDMQMLRAARILKCESMEKFVERHLKMEINSNEPSTSSQSSAQSTRSNPAYPLEFLHSIKKYRQNQRYLDCLLSIERVEHVRAHRCILAAVSPVFADLISSVGEKAAVTLGFQKGDYFMSLQTATELVEFIYTGELVNMKKSHMSHLLKSAEKLKIEGLKKMLISILWRIDNEKKEKEKKKKEEMEMTEEDGIEYDLINEYNSIYEDYVDTPLKQKRKAIPRQSWNRKIELKKIEQKDSSEPEKVSIIIDQKSKKQGISYKTVVEQDIYVGDQVEMMEKPFKCGYCEHRAKSNSSIQKHVRSIHTQESPYKCTECDAEFKVQSNLVRHQRSHRAEKPYRCTKCGIRYADRRSIDKHVLQVHFNASAIRCSAEQCKSKFFRQDRYVAHYKKEHGGIPQNLFYEEDE